MLVFMLHICLSLFLTFRANYWIVFSNVGLSSRCVSFSEKELGTKFQNLRTVPFLLCKNYLSQKVVFKIKILSLTIYL